ncbi:hypothetical protein N9T37_00255 [bacterium]|nr:hypothetical protein [bacterium]
MSTLMVNIKREYFINAGVFLTALFVYFILNMFNWNILKACNDVFFNADTNEVYQQIDNIYLNKDMMRHFVSYLALFSLNKLFIIFGLSKLSLFSFIGAINVSLSYVFFRKHEVTIALSIMLSILYLFSFGQLTVGIFPETYGVTMSLVWVYLLMYYSVNLKNEQMLGYEVRRIVFAAVIGSNHLPLAAVYFIGRSKYLKDRPFYFIFGCFIVGTMSFAPYLAAILARGGEEVFGFAQRYADLGHFIDLNSWKATLINIFGISVVSPFPRLINIYYFPYPYAMGPINIFGTSIWLLLLISSAFRTILSYRDSILIDKNLSVIFAIISIFMFYLYLSPKNSALYGVTLLPFFFILLADSLKKSRSKLYLVGILILIPIVAFTGIETLLSPIVSECKSWGVRPGLGYSGA